DLERHLSRNGTRVLKFFLHVSRDEQRRRFLERIEDPAKRWKFALGDVAERQHWDDYMNAYEQAIRHTATKDAPWHVVPADNKWFSRLVVGATIVAALAKIDPQFPTIDGAGLKALDVARTQLHNEATDKASGAANLAGERNDSD